MLALGMARAPEATLSLCHPPGAGATLSLCHSHRAQGHPVPVSLTLSLGHPPSSELPRPCVTHPVPVLPTRGRGRLFPLQWPPKKIHLGLWEAKSRN